uniref:Uncharacterized protein n=1 Tax=Physcomitrium patens TaxID=3218 RepID=A0A2K1J7L1_PHYPA|nr:hypothetical protein PHYPA_020616 [Physcomitrium patens]
MSLIDADPFERESESESDGPCFLLGHRAWRRPRVLPLFAHVSAEQICTLSDLSQEPALELVWVRREGGY